MSLLPRNSEILAPPEEATLYHEDPIRRFHLSQLPGYAQGGLGARVLIIHTGHLGDIVLAISAMRRIRESLPKAEIMALVTPPANVVLQAMNIFDHVVVLPEISNKGHRPINYLKWAVAAGRCLGFSPHLGVSLLADPEDQLLLALSGANARIGAIKDINWIYNRAWLTHAIRWESLPDRRSTRSHIIAEFTGATSTCTHDEAAALKDLQVDARFRESARPFLDTTRPNIAVLICGSIAHRRWPLERYFLLVQGLARQGKQVTVVTGPTERDIAPAVSDFLETTGTGKHFQNQPLLSLVALLQGADAAITVDSGPGHLAAATGTPTVYLLPQRKLGSFLPPGGHVEPVTGDEVAHITVEGVEQAFLRLMEKKRKGLPTWRS